MFYMIHVVEDSQISADWALVDEEETFHLFIARSANTAQTYAEAGMLMRKKRQAIPQPRESGLMIGLPV